MKNLRDIAKIILHTQEHDLYGKRILEEVKKLKHEEYNDSIKQNKTNILNTLNHVTRMIKGE